MTAVDIVSFVNISGDDGLVKGLSLAAAPLQPKQHTLAAPRLRPMKHLAMTRFLEPCKSPALAPLSAGGHYPRWAAKHCRAAVASARTDGRDLSHWTLGRGADAGFSSPALWRVWDDRSYA